VHKTAFDLVIAEARTKLAVGARALRIAKAVTAGRNIASQSVPAAAAATDMAGIRELAKQIASTRSRQGLLVAKPEDLQETGRRAATAMLKAKHPEYREAAKKVINYKRKRDGHPTNVPFEIPEILRATRTSIRGNRSRPVNLWHRRDDWEKLLEKVEASQTKVRLPPAVESAYAKEVTNNPYKLDRLMYNASSRVYSPSLADRVKGLFADRLTSEIYPSSSVNPWGNSYLRGKVSPWTRNPAKLVDAWREGYMLTPQQMQRSEAARRQYSQPLLDQYNKVRGVHDRVNRAYGESVRAASNLPVGTEREIDHVSSLGPIMAKLIKNNPTVRVKGFDISKLPELDQLAAAGEPLWYSGRPDVPLGYLSNYKMPALAVTDERTLKTFGPTGPLHHHVARDTRNLSADAARKLPMAAAARNKEWAVLPDYEQVTTTPNMRTFVTSQQLFRPSPSDPSKLKKLSPKAFGYQFQD
jgi:hypothetical protein